MSEVVSRDAIRLPYTVDGDGSGDHLVFAHGLTGLASADWDGDPIHPLQTAKDVAAAAGVDLIEADAAAIQADRPAIGRLLSGALAKLV